MKGIENGAGDDLPIIFLWVHPRSLSTALERAFMERDDSFVFHEPFSYVYYVLEERDIPGKNIDPNHPIQYEAIKNWILSKATAAASKASESNYQFVFAKDMPYHAYKYLVKDDSFLKRIKHIFLIRDPQKAVASHFKINPDVTLEEIGIERQWHFYQHVAKVTGTKPTIMDADDLLANPQKALAALCSAVGLPVKSVVTWNAEQPKQWNTWQGWHDDAAKSTGFKQIGPKEKHKIILQENPHLLAMVKHHQQYYDKMYQLRLRWS